MRRRYQTGGLAAGMDDDGENDDAVMDPEADEDSDMPGGSVTSAGGLAALDIPGAQEAFSLMQKSAADARTALQEARSSIMARQYSKADALFAASAALGAPTRAGSTAESFGAMAGALRGPLAAKREFETQQQKDLLGVNTQLAGLDEREATARLALAQLRAKLGVQAGSASNDRIVGPDGKLHYASHAEARQPGVVAWAPPGTKIDLGQKQESASETEIGTGLGKQFNLIQQRGLGAGDELANYDRLEYLLDGVRSGKLRPTVMQIGAIADSFGLKIDRHLGPEQAAEALSNELALKLRDPSGGAGMPGALSDQDRIYLKSMTPGLAKTPEGNALIIETGRKLAQRKMEIAQVAQEYYEKHGKLDVGLYKEVREFAKSHPLFETKRAPPTIGARPPAPAAAAAAAATAPAGAAPASGVPPLLRRPDVAAPAAPATPDDDNAAAGAPEAAEQLLRANPTDDMKRFFITKYGYLPDGIPL